MRKLFRLFYEMFCIALFVVGGGYAIIAVADEVFSRKLKWTKEGELAATLLLRRTMGVIRIILTCVALSVLLSLSGTP